MNMNIKRIGWGTLCGMIAGIICVLGNIPNIPIDSANASYLVIAFWERTILGLIIGCFGSVEIKKGNPIVDAIIRGAFFGMSLSWHMAFFSNIFSINYFFAGIVFGILIDIILTLKVN